MRLNGNGEYVWTEKKVTMSSAPGAEKFRLTASDFAHNQWIAVWTDGRNSPPKYTEGIYAQNINSDGSLCPTGVEEEKGELASSLTLYPISPNPSGLEVAIRYALPEEMKISLKVYDVNGRLVKVLADKEQNSGIHSVSWDGRDEKDRKLPNGVYFCRLKSGDEHRISRIVLIR